MAKPQIQSFQNFLLYHRFQLDYLHIPSHFWETIHQKCSNSVFDAGSVFSFEEVDLSLENQAIPINKSSNWKVSVVREKGIFPEDSQHIYLIDHAYTYSHKNIELDLLENEALRTRVASVMNFSSTDYDSNKLVGNILMELWRYCQCCVYTQNESHDNLWTLWYIMDELGVRIRHSQDPTFRAVPFFYVKDRLAFTLLYPIKFVAYGGEVTRNFVEGQYSDDLSYKAALLPWKYDSFLNIDCCPIEPHVSFIQSGRIKESLPEVCANESTIIRSDKKLKVYCDYGVIQKNLSHPAFEFTIEESSADVLWLTYHFKDYKDLAESPHKYVNQFAFEHLLTSKDLLAVVSRRTVALELINKITLDANPLWLPATFNLNTELCKFVSYFQQREEKKLDNYWIVKPWNRARGADMYITNDINCIVRLPTSGPKIACKYITDPVLFPVESVGLVKMDIRYIIVLKKVNPLELYVYKNFWLRFANKPFSLDSFDDYEKHFTVMNYSGFNLKQMYCSEFIEKFEDYYSDFKWADIQDKIFEVLKDVLKGATSCPPPAGLFNNPQSRAMYGVDMMLEWNRKYDKPQIQPMLLEINWAPDCYRACQYYPDFFNDIFESMFLDVKNSNFVLL